MKKITFFNQKGGVGKTGSTVHIAGVLSKTNKVLVIDCDPQSDATLFLNQIPEHHLENYLEDTLEGKVPLKDLIHQGMIQKGDKILPINIDFIPISPRAYDLEIEDLLVIQKQINNLDYDYVLFDCPPQRSSITACAMCASDYVIIPAMPDSASLQGYDMAVNLINELRKSRLNETLIILGMFVNQFNPRNSVEKFIYDSSVETFGNIIFNTTIRNATAIRQARFFSMPLAYYMPRSNVAKDYEKLATEILERIDNQKIGR